MGTPPLRLSPLSPELSSAPICRREPYLLFFPLGALLAWAGVLPWLLFSLGATGLYGPMFEAIGYRAAFHPVAQVEGFLTCFAVGFLFTFIPRRTGTAPPAAWEMGLGLGIGGLLLPAIPRGVDPTAERPPRGWAYALHALLAAAFAATFFLEHLASVQAAYALRAAITLAVVI